MALRLTEAKLRKIIREEIMESFGGSMNPRGLEMTPEEVMIQQKLMNSPKGEKLLNDLAKAVRAQLGPAAKDPAKVAALLDREAESAEVGELREGEDAARDYLLQQRAYALGDRQQALANIATGAAVGSIGYLLASLAEVAGMPLENVITLAKYAIPALAVSSISSEIGIARAATKSARDYSRVLKGRPAPKPAPGKLEVPKTKF